MARAGNHLEAAAGDCRVHGARLLDWRQRVLFSDDDQRRYRGRFVTARRDRPLYPKGRAVEIFYLDGDPATNVSSLVLRWYWRLGGATLSDEASDNDFADEGLEMEWSD